MLSYRHIYHAGNHADILKHLVVSQICHHLTAKESPFFYLDTHAGIGQYALDSQQAQMNKEFKTGISQLLELKKPPESIKRFLKIVKDMNPTTNLKLYPGSPKVVEAYTRQKDKMHLCELHPKDYPTLAALFPNKRRANVEKGNGFAAVKAMLPPPQKRGLVLMDPPYEVKEDYKTVVKALVDGHQRFSHGTYAIWYPVLSRKQADGLINAVQRTKIRNTLLLELNIRDDNADKGMNGSGMIIVNPPWKLESEAQEFLPVLKALLQEDSKSSFQLRWITPE
ncbi:23S rRNA (adenine(2030)-N(6))-methyltransferase RlmJ [Marinomonas sp. PE14-40]|uniref:23S rRNA (adenine(2030)-N(6))-methyltransferase RlmJ n=1 Tax=Marinomonas sp. PE14-40 TaxID=3060621 RepID=UPI003F667CC1